MRVTEGTATPVSLSNSHIEVSDVVFENMSLPSTPGIVRISFSVSYKNTAGRYEYNFSKSSYGAAALRDN